MGLAAQDEKHQGMQRIGIDIGRVIIGPVVNGKADTSFLGSRLEDALRTPPAEGAIEGVADLVERTDGAGVADLEVRAGRAGEDAGLARPPRLLAAHGDGRAATCGSACGARTRRCTRASCG
jgi:hypothetical protein